ncbi:CtsR family transcriptional regulator [Lacticaseibacillus brantae]|nr:CtsR family transcriptional regulator [Lacticaseibacillus brantae]
MQHHSMADIIELYIEELLADSPQVKIRRAEIAQQFNCAPSQINYVIQTRFKPERGYIVESKRGGGGYIQIEKMKLQDEQMRLAMIRDNLPSALSQQDAQSLVQDLFNSGIVDQQSGNLMLSALSHQTLNFVDLKVENQLRAQLMLAFLDTLRYER